MPKYGEVKLTNEAADALKERAKAEFEKQKQRARGAKLLFREFIEAKIGNSASNYYNAIAPRRMMKSTLEAILKAFNFAPDDATLYDPGGTLMNVKPVYTITDTRRNVKIDVCFAPLTASDTKILRGEDWEGARFRDVWIETAEQEAGWKLSLCEGEDKSILGVVRLGHAPQFNGEKGALRDSLLEAAPVHRYGTTQRGYRGIGRVLVARLVEESKAQGADGSVLVRPVQGSVPFYERLGFRPARIPPYYRLSAQAAEVLLQGSQE